AVSSTNRSTSVVPAPAAARCSLPLQRAVGGRTYVLVVAANTKYDDTEASLVLDEALCVDHQLTQSDWNSPRCEELAALSRGIGASRGTLTPVQIELVPRALSTRSTPAEVDCLSGYDAVYDYAVYG